MCNGLLARRQFTPPVGIGLPKNKPQLKKQHAGAPHTGGSPEPRQDHFGDHRLHLEEKEGRHGNRQRVKEHVSGVTLQANRFAVGGARRIDQWQLLVFFIGMNIQHKNRSHRACGKCGRQAKAHKKS